MEKSSTKDPSETPEFFCHLCSVTCASALNLQSHFLGVKHRLIEEALRNLKKDNVVEKHALQPAATLQEHMDTCKNSEPAVGLEYIYQYQKVKSIAYECKLCECHSGMIHMFMHIIGAKHRVNYMRKHHPSIGSFGPYVPSGPKKLKKLKDACIKVETEFGRQKINVLQGMDTQGSFLTGNTGASSAYFNPDSELNDMDFTSDDLFGTSKKPKASEHLVTFLELKAAHEADKSAASSSDGIAHKEESEKVKPIKATEQEVKATEQEVKATEQEVKATEQEVKATEQEVKATEQEVKATEQEVKATEQEVKATEEEVKATEEEVKATEEEVKATEEEVKASEEEVKATDESMNETYAQEVPNEEFCESSQDFTSNKDLFDFLEHFRIVEIKDAEFVISALEMLSFALIDHETNCKKKILCKPTSENPIEQQKSQNQDPPRTVVPSKQDPTMQSKKPLFPISQPMNIEPLGQRKKMTFTLPSNKDQGSKLQCNDSSSTKCDPTTNVFQIKAPQVNQVAPCAQTTFPPSDAPFPPGAAPPLFPIGKTDVVKTFFESIKNMEVAEVITTLNKITATNPAFRGIHVPSLVRYLTETGKLKSSNTMQPQNR